MTRDQRPTAGRSRSARAIPLLVWLSLLPVPDAGAADLTGAARSYDLPAGSLASALNRFAEQSELQLIYDAPRAQGLAVPAIAGRHTPEEVLGRLLADTGLRYRISDARTVTIEAADPMAKLLAEARRPLPVADAEPVAQPKDKKAPEPSILPEMTVTASPYDETSYSVPNASTATKTDTPTMETPVSIQVVPRAVLDDQQAIRLEDITKNVSGVQPMRQLGDFFEGFILRGFRSSDFFNVYRDGLRLGFQSFETANLERVEVLKGPVSTLYGRSQPGGLVNIITKKPLTEPYYSLSQQFGSYDLYRTTLDATGLITDGGALAYRLNFVYLDSDSFRDFVERERIFVAPQLTWKWSEATEFNFGLEYKNDDLTGDRGIPAIGNRPANVSIGRFIGEPAFSLNESESYLVHFGWIHRFDENWKIQQRFVANLLDSFSRNIIPISLRADNRTVDRGLFNGLIERETYATDINLNGKLDFLGTHHNVLFGFDYLRFDQSGGVTFLASAPSITPIDVFNPVYGTVRNPENLPKNFFFTSRQEWYGLYFQDQIDITDNLHFLFSGRHDWSLSSDGFSAVPGPVTVTKLTTAQFSPRVGLVYQPLNWLSLYANWTEGLGVNNGRSADGRPFDPELAEEFEGGIKTEFFEGRLNATLAAYELTKQNILTPDTATPDPLDSVAIGEARSQGVEFDFSGQLTEHLNIIGNYGYINTKVLRDNSGLQGKRLPNVPRHSGSFWLNYEFKEGFELGTGVFVADQRQANVANDFQLPGYVRWDAMAAYHWKVDGSRVTAQVNVNNILDKEYFLYADQVRNPRFDAMPGEPLTVLGSLRLEY